MILLMELTPNLITDLCFDKNLFCSFCEVNIQLKNLY